MRCSMASMTLKFLLLTFLSTGLVAGRVPLLLLGERDLSLDGTARTNDITPRFASIVREFDPGYRHFKRAADLPTPATIPSPHLIERAKPPPTATTTTFPDDPAPPGTEWDQSFIDSDKRRMVKNAWNEAMRLAGLAAEGLTTLANTYPASGANIPEVMSNIAHTSPAMAQVFGSENGRIQDIRSVFQRMIDLIPNPNQGPRNGVVLRVALGNTVKQDDGRTKICGAKTSDISTYAAVFNPTRPELPTDLQKKYQLADAIIFFCDAFFTELEDDSTLLSQSPMLDRLRARGQTVLHEWTHLEWIADTNNDDTDPERYGFEEVGKLYNERGWDGASKNADSYAVFASYHAYNQERYAPSDERPGFGCKDVWPRGANNAEFSPVKPVKDSFP